MAQKPLQQYRCIQHEKQDKPSSLPKANTTIQKPFMQATTINEDKTNTSTTTKTKATTQIPPNNVNNNKATNQQRQRKQAQRPPRKLNKFKTINK